MSTRTETRPQVNAAGAIYGQVLASSEVAALSLDKTLDSAEILAALAGTLLVFWLAHVYAHTVSERLGPQRRPTLLDIRRAMAREWPMVQAGVPAAMALLLGAAGVYKTSTAVTLALLLGVVNLFGWGVAVARRAGMTGFPIVIVGAVNAAFGLAVEGLKVLVH